VCPQKRTAATVTRSIIQVLAVSQTLTQIAEEVLPIQNAGRPTILINRVIERDEDVVVVEVRVGMNNGN
jgi:hypothetical protein